MSKATFSVAPSRPSVQDFLDDDLQETKITTPRSKPFNRSISNPTSTTQKVDSSMGFLDQDALMKIGDLLHGISSENKIKDEERSKDHHSNETSLMPEEGFGHWSTKKLDKTVPDQLLLSHANQRGQSSSKQESLGKSRGQTVDRSWGSVEGIATKTDDYLIEMREKAAIVIQRWYRRMNIRRTAGAAAMKRMMASKKQEMEARMSYEREEVSRILQENFILAGKSGEKSLDKCQSYRIS